VEDCIYISVLAVNKDLDNFAKEDKVKLKDAFKQLLLFDSSLKPILIRFAVFAIVKLFAISISSASSLSYLLLLSLACLTLPSAAIYVFFRALFPFLLVTIVYLLLTLLSFVALIGELIIFYVYNLSFLLLGVICSYCVRLKPKDISFMSFKALNAFVASVCSYGRGIRVSLKIG
jgi:hypothetical protein